MTVSRKPQRRKPSEPLAAQITLPEPVLGNPIDRIVPDFAVTLDVALKHNPSHIKDSDLEDLIVGFRAERVTFTQKDEAKKAKKQGIEDEPINTDEEELADDE